MQTSTIGCCSHSPGITPALQLPLPKALGGTKTLCHCPFPGPYNEEQLVQHILCGLSGTGCFLHSLQVVEANCHSYPWFQRWAWPTTTGDTRKKITCSPNHLRGHHTEGHCVGTPHVVALTTDAWSLSLSRNLQLGAASAAPSMCVK